MTLKSKITEDMKAAMRARETARLSAIRLLLAAIKRHFKRLRSQQLPPKLY